MSSFGGVPIRRMHRKGGGIVGNTLHYLARLANNEHAFKYNRGIGEHSISGYLYVPKSSVAKQFAGGRIHKRRRHRRR